MTKALIVDLAKIVDDGHGNMVPEQTQRDLTPQELAEMPPSAYHTLVEGEWMLNIEALLNAYEIALDNHIEGVVRGLKDASGKPYRFSSITSAVSYAGAEGDPRQQIAQALMDWRTSFWAAVDAIYDEVIADTRPLPEVEAMIAELPAFHYEPEEEA